MMMMLVISQRKCKGAKEEEEGRTDPRMIRGQHKPPENCQSWSQGHMIPGAKMAVQMLVVLHHLPPDLVALPPDHVDGDSSSSEDRPITLKVSSRPFLTFSDRPLTWLSPELEGRRP
jgi:hypothetical protein